MFPHPVILSDAAGDRFDSSLLPCLRVSVSLLRRPSRRSRHFGPYYSHQPSDDLLWKRKPVFDRAKDGVNKAALICRGARNFWAKLGRTERPPKGLPFEWVADDSINPPTAGLPRPSWVTQGTLCCYAPSPRNRRVGDETIYRGGLWLLTHWKQTSICIAALHKKRFPNDQKTIMMHTVDAYGGFPPSFRCNNCSPLEVHTFKLMGRGFPTALFFFLFRGDCR